MKAAREALGESGRRKAGKVAIERLLALPAFQSASEIYCYLDFGTEVPTGEILREAWRQHKQVWAPRVQGRQIRFCPVTSTGKLHPGVFGIPEPEEGIEGEGKEGLAIVPGLAFDEHLNRLGYGGGFYDRFLAGHPGLRRVGLAFECQILASLPVTELDCPMDVVVTERRSIYANGTAQRPGNAAERGEHQTQGSVSLP